MFGTLLLSFLLAITNGDPNYYQNYPLYQYDYPSFSSPAIEDYVYAHCNLQPGIANVGGTIDFRQRQRTVFGQPCQCRLDIRVNVTGINPHDNVILHGFHVHMYGDVGNACNNAAGHFNPLNTDHGSPPDSPNRRHVGDFGNLQEDANGNIFVQLTDYLASLTGENSIIGRSMVLHAQPDDLGRGGDTGSRTTGNAGPRLACCVIGSTDGRYWG